MTRLRKEAEYLNLEFPVETLETRILFSANSVSTVLDALTEESHDGSGRSRMPAEDPVIPVELHV